MARAILLVMDSVGIGGAKDAEKFGDEGADTLGHIAAACASGAADRPGLRSGPLKIPVMNGLGIGARGRSLDRRASAGHRADRKAAGDLGLCQRGLEGQGHAVRPLGARRPAGAVRLGLFPEHHSGLSEGPDRPR